MKAYLKTAKGENKIASEDRVLANKIIYVDAMAQVDNIEGIIAIADGVGGNCGGATAAEMICTSLIKPEAINDELFAIANHEIVEKGKSDAALCDMATTLSGISFSTEGDTFLFHVGNTRVYAIKAMRYLEQLTRDDTVVDFLVLSGRLTEDEAQSYQARNEITACFGGGKETLLKLTLKKIDPDSYIHFLITSDGVHEFLSIDDMEDILEATAGDWNKSVEILIKQAKKNGSKDDCSAVIIVRD